MKRPHSPPTGNPADHLKRPHDIPAPDETTDEIPSDDDYDEADIARLGSWARTLKVKKKLAPPKDLFNSGISGVRGATIDAFADLAAAARANEVDWELQARRYEENRNQDDPQLIIKFKVPAGSTLPTTSNDREEIMDALIIACGLDFIIHRKWHWQIVGDVPLGNDKRAFIGYISLAPASTNKLGHREASNLGSQHHMAQLEEVLVYILSSVERYTSLPNMPIAQAQTLRLTLPYVNACSELPLFLLAGIDIEALLGSHRVDNIQTYRFLACELFHELRATHRVHCSPVSPHHAAFSGRTDRFAIESILSFKQFRRGTASVLAICIASGNQRAHLLATAIQDYYVTQHLPVSLGGGLLSCTIAAIPDARRDAISKLVDDIYTKNKTPFASSPSRVIRRDDAIVGQGAISSITAFRSVVRSIPNCRGAFARLHHGRSSPRLTVYIDAGDDNEGYRRTAQSIADEIFQANPDIPHLRPDPTPTPSTQVPIHLTTTRPLRSRGSPPQKSRGRKAPSRLDAINPSNFTKSTFDLLRGHGSISSSWHAIIVCAGGIFGADVLHGHFDDDNIRGLVEGVSYAWYKSFPNQSAAMRYFQSYYPHISSPADITRMHQHAPLESSNFNIPNTLIRHDCLSRKSVDELRKTGKPEHVMINGLDPALSLSRLRASQRRHNLGVSETASYDFFRGTDDPDLQYDTSALSTTEATSGTLPDDRLSSVSLLDDAIFPATHPDYAPHRTNPSDNIGGTSGNFDDDGVSMISEHTGHLSLHQRESPPKRPKRDNFQRPASVISPSSTVPRSPSCVLSIIVDAAASPAAISDLLADCCTAANTELPSSLPTPSFYSIVSPPTKKKAYIVFPNNTSAYSIWAACRTHRITTVPSLHDSLPDPPTIDRLDPSCCAANCRITTCAHYYCGDDIPDWAGDNGPQLAHTHGITYHRDFLMSLPDDVLQSIDWYRCIGCREPHFSQDLLNLHMLSCQAAITATNLPPRHESDPYKSFVQKCPPSHRNDLIRLIDDPTDPPGPESLMNQIFTWLTDSSGASTPAASTHSST